MKQTYTIIIDEQQRVLIADALRAHLATIETPAADDKILLELFDNLKTMQNEAFIRGEGDTTFGFCF